MEDERHTEEWDLLYLKSHIDLLAKLEWNYKVFESAEKEQSGYIAGAYFTAIYAAIDFAVTAWHMSEWAYAVLTVADKGRYPKLKGFQDALCSDHRALDICEQLANCAKHHVRKEHLDKPHIRSKAFPYANHFRAGSGRAGDPLSRPAFLISYKGESIPAKVIFLEALNYWRECCGFNVIDESSNSEV